jgi:DNA-binding NtrC family response regulator
MAARIILVHDDDEFLTGLERRLQAGGHNVVVFEDSNIAFDALKGPTSVDVLVTQDQFRPGQPLA